MSTSLVLGAAAPQHAFAQAPPPVTAGGDRVVEGTTRNVEAITGTLTVVYRDDFEHGRSERLYFLREHGRGRRLRLRFSGEPPEGLRTGAVVNVTGAVSGDEVTVLAAQADDAGTLPITGDASQALAAAVSGEQRTLVVVANFRDTSVSCTPADINNYVFADPGGLSVDAMYRETSLGQLSFAGSVSGPYTIAAASTDPCDLGAWADAAKTAAAADGVDVASFARRVYVMPPSTCAGAGFGTVGGNPSSAWVFTCDLRGVYAHELGHNLGMDHAATLASEYGDNSDTMGPGSPQLPPANAPHRQQLGWHGPAGVLPVTADGMFDVAPLAADPASTGAAQMLLIPKPDTGESYYVSYRRRIGFDRQIDGSFIDRLSIHRYKGDGSASKTWLMAVLGDGQGFTDSAAGVSISLVSHADTHATVRVEITPVCVAARPSVTLSPPSQSGTPGASASYTLSLRNEDTPVCAPSTFALSAAVPSGWAGSLSPASVTLAPGATGTANVTVIVPASAAIGTYSVGARAVDGSVAAHNVSSTGAFVVTAPCVSSAPAMSVSPTTQSGTPGSAVSYTVTLINRDSTACPATTFALQAAPPAAWTATTSPAAIALAPGRSGTATLLVTSSAGATAASYGVMVRASDVAQGNHATSASVSYTVLAPADTAAPSAPTGLVATASQKTKQIKVSWVASADNVGVAGYHVSRNGAIVATTNATAWVDAAWIAGATCSYSVTAFDAAGNVSDPSTSVTVTIGGGGGRKK